MTTFSKRMQHLQERLDIAEIDVALITDDDNIYYLTGYHDYLHMEFGRPTILVVSRAGKSHLITPEIDLNTARARAEVDRIAAWNDGVGEEWRETLPNQLAGARTIAIEPDRITPVVRTFLDGLKPDAALCDLSPVLADMRMIKSAEELQLARHAGQVANAMMAAGRTAIADGAAEFEVSLAVAQAGTRKAAALLSQHYGDSTMSPNIQFLQIMASGDAICETHHRASTRIMRRGEPVFLCFCGMTNFHRFKLGFDRTFWIGEIVDETQRDLYEVAVASQKAALDVLGPGVAAEAVHAAYAEVIQTAGFEAPFRCGRATGFSYLEKPQLVTGDKTILRPAMVFAVDGSVTGEGFRAQVGDSFIITETGYEQITDHPKSIEEMIL